MFENSHLSTNAHVYCSNDILPFALNFSSSSSINFFGPFFIEIYLINSIFCYERNLIKIHVCDSMFYVSSIFLRNAFVVNKFQTFLCDCCIQSKQKHYLFKLSSLPFVTRNKYLLRSANESQDLISTLAKNGTNFSNNLVQWFIKSKEP